MLKQITSSPLVSGSGARTSALHGREPLAARAIAPDYAPDYAPGYAPDYAGASASVLRGRKAILEAQPRLVELARECGQSGEADSLAYFLSTPDAVKKTPHLLLIDGLAGANTTSGGLSAAVLVFEYKTPFGGTRIFATSDSSGRRGVIAPAHLRARAAACAARTLIGRGAQVVLISFAEVHDDSDRQRDPIGGASNYAAARNAATALPALTAELRRFSRGLPPAHWCLREGHHPAYLPLLPSFDATLARIGQRTRSNLRYYRRRCELDLGCSFVAKAVLTLEEFMAFNRACSFAVDDALAIFRYRTLGSQPNFALRGVRDRDGRWLALAGLRRQNGFVEIDWQMNRAGMASASLCTVLRSYLIEHEIALGSTRLYIEGGTAQPLSRSFLKERVSDLTVKRDSRYVRLLERFRSFIFPPKNYVRCTLQNPDLHWRPW